MTNCVACLGETVCRLKPNWRTSASGMGWLGDYELLPTDPELLHAINLGKDHDHLRAMVCGGVDVDGTDGWENTP